MTLTPPDQHIRRRRLLGVGLRADLVTPADSARDIRFADSGFGCDLALIEGVDNLCQCLAIGLTTLRGSDVFNQRFGFLGLTPLSEQTSPILAREGVRGAVAEYLASDPRVTRIVDLQVNNPMEVPTGASRRVLDVRVDFETVGGDIGEVSTGGLASGERWGGIDTRGMAGSIQEESAS